MSEFLLNKILLTILILCVLNCLKHTWSLLNGFMEEIPNKYEISTRERFLLGLSISYIITTIFTGTLI